MTVKFTATKDNLDLVEEFIKINTSPELYTQFKINERTRSLTEWFVLISAITIVGGVFIT